MRDARAIVLREYGGAERLAVENIALGAPGPGELLIIQTAIGVNFHDIYVRSGQYRTLALPGIPGIEGVGVVDAVGDDVEGWRPGDRVAYISSQYGAYTSARMLPAALAFRLPDNLPDTLAAAMMLRGLTVDMLTIAVRRLMPDETVLIHAAAGGVGRLLVQAAAQAGARVIGTAGSLERAEIAKAAGASEVILYRDEDFVTRVRAICSEGVDVVYDSVGNDTIKGSFEVLKRCGHLVVFGQSSGPVPPIEVSMLAAKSLTVSRPILFDYLRDRGKAEKMVERLFTLLQHGKFLIPVIKTMRLEDAMAAHLVLESRSAHDAIVLVP
jgi:NADPH2:quinone reductase